MFSSLERLSTASVLSTLRTKETRNLIIVINNNSNKKEEEKEEEKGEQKNKEEEKEGKEKGETTVPATSTEHQPSRHCFQCFHGLRYLILTTALGKSPIVTHIR